MLVDLVQAITRDGVRLDGMLQKAEQPSTVRLDAVCLIHGTGGNFYSSALFDSLGRNLLQLGVSVLRVNTRGHDGISTAVSAQGGRRLGAAYELVDDCRHDVAAWLDWLRINVGPRNGLIGHSLGAVKCLYALAHEMTLAPPCVIAVSPPRLSYGWFCSSPEREVFLEDFHRAEQEVEAGRPNALIEVKLPLPIAITAAGYLEKYGPDERYNYLGILPSLRCPTLITLGSVEAENNMAFRGAAADIEPLIQRYPQLSQAMIAGADHFYTAARPALWACIQKFLQAR